MRRVIKWLVAASCVCSPVCADTVEERVARVLANTPLIDGHNDIPWQYRRRADNQLSKLDLGADLTGLERPTHTDIPRMRRGKVGGQFWSVYVPIAEYGGSTGDVQLVLEQIDLVHRMVDRYDDSLEMAYTAADVIRIHGEGRIASMIGMEGGHAINDSLAVLRQLYQLGARYMTLTHSKGLRWVDSATDEARHGGLTVFGEAVVAEMNRLGMLVDLSHVSPETMRDAIRVSEAPVIFSHSSAYGVVQHARNVPDDVLKLVAERNGIVMVTFFPSYVSEELRLHGVAARRERERLSAVHSSDELADLMMRWREENPAPKPTLGQVADHIEHIRRVAGIDHIGLGGDYDGMPPGPVGLEDVSTYPALLAELLRRGYSDGDISKIAGTNILRVMAAAERVAARLTQRREPLDVLIGETDAVE